MSLNATTTKCFDSVKRGFAQTLKSKSWLKNAKLKGPLLWMCVSQKCLCFSPDPYCQKAHLNQVFGSSSLSALIEKCHLNT